MEQLKYLIENDMIDMAYVQAQFEMNKRKEYLEKHKYRIWKGKDGKWRTYLPDTKVGRKQLKRNTQKEIENAVVQFYESQDTMAEIVTFKDMYFRWRKVQDKLVGDNTITKYETDLTGMRVEEIAALSWSNIFDSYILVDKSEKYNRRTKDFYIDSTKNGKERVFPITEEIRGLLERVKKAELQYGFICEWFFAGKEGRIHAYRRTVNSKMRCEGVSATVAAALLGHSEEVNRKMPMAN